MLNIHFINVADGDSILIEQNTAKGMYRLLIDTGRAAIADVEGSLRQTAPEYFKAKGISHIDDLVITHLHYDHFGALGKLMETVSFDRMYAAFIPEAGWGRAPEEPEAIKTVQGLIGCINQWAGNVEALRAAGTELIPVRDTMAVTFGEGIRAELLCTDVAESARQREILGGMLSGRELSADDKYWVSKSRNPCSLRVRIRYAGRILELAGDCYGELWQHEDLPRCDLFKAPHHGDCKSITPMIAEKLHPEYAVISCSQVYMPEKDRPSRDTADLLLGVGAKLYYTDSFSDQVQQPVYWHEVEFVISDDGTIIPPKA